MGVVAVVALGAAGVLVVALLSAGDRAAPTTAPDAGFSGGENTLVAVKVDNAERARPQIGLNAARYIFETPVEGGITRFLAFFEPGDVLVGPVRSARPVDVDLVGLLADTLVSTGGRPFVLGALRGNGIVLAGGQEGDSLLQTLERPSPHNQFVVLSDVAAGPTQGGIPVGDLPEEEAAGAVVEVGGSSRVTWTFLDGLYSRAEDDEVTMVLPDWGADPQPLTADTVIVMEVNPRSAGYVDVNGVEVPTFDVIGSGRLRVYHQNVVVEGTWWRASLEAGYVFRGDDGEAFGVPPGRTFIHLLPAN